jgi:hypothetical protein
LGHEGTPACWLHINETINADHYIQTLQKLRQAIHRKRVGMLTRGVKILHDNATPHTAGKTRETIEKMCWKFLNTPLTALTSHPLTSTYLESWKNTCQENVLPLSGKWNWLTNLDVNFYAECILKLVLRWDMCLNMFGGYVEK